MLKHYQRELVDALIERGHSLNDINHMYPDEMFSEYCNWKGLIGWAETLLGIQNACNVFEDELISKEDYEEIKKNGARWEKKK